MIGHSSEARGQVSHVSCVSKVEGQRSVKSVKLVRSKVRFSGHRSEVRILRSEARGQRPEVKSVM